MAINLKDNESSGSAVGGIGLTDLSATSPLNFNNLTGEFSIQQSNTLQAGYLSNTDWNTFNNKQDVDKLGTKPLSANAKTPGLPQNGQFLIWDNANDNYTLGGGGGIGLTDLSSTTPLNFDNSTGVFSIQQSSTLQPGYLSDTDWNTFNNKQNVDKLGTKQLSAIALNPTGTDNKKAVTYDHTNNTYTLSSVGATIKATKGFNAPWGGFVPNTTYTWHFSVDGVVPDDIVTVNVNRPVHLELLSVGGGVLLNGWVDGTGVIAVTARFTHNINVPSYSVFLIAIHK